MSGHNKWSTIKRKKGAADAKRSNIFSKIVKEISVAVKESGPDPEGNPRLRMAIQNAKGVNMPKDNIERAINKASGEGAIYQEMTFEGYATGGVAIFVECLSDNNNRTVSNMRAIFNKRNGSLGTNGSLAFIFDRKGVFTVPKGNINQEEFELEVIDGGAEEMELIDDKYIIKTSFEDFGNMQRKLEELKIEPENAELQRIPNTFKSIDLETAKKVFKMIDAFEDDDDVQNVFHNMEMTDEIEKFINEE
jgi:YebC/PmpR family DNA-binding regulatory protein